MKVLDVDVYISLESNILERDKIKLRKSNRDYYHDHMAKMKDNEHAKIITELEKRLKDIAKKIEYEWKIGCKEGDGKNDKKKEEGEKTKTRKKTEVKLYKHRAYGYK